MKRIIFSSEFFNIKDTLECGQVFRFKPYQQGFLSFTADKCAYCYNADGNAVIECADGEEDYFKNYFDLERDYSLIFGAASLSRAEILKRAAAGGKGIRILNQNPVETLFSFIVSQNNNIPRIKGIIEKLCAAVGEVRDFCGEKFFTFPTAEKMAEKDIDFYRQIGLGYRAEYIKRLAEDIAGGLRVEDFNSLNTAELKKKLISLYGVGPKVADCVALFGFHRSDSFPVDTWIEKVYREDFKGNVTSREKISEWFVSEFKTNSGYFQQYLFHYKRTLEKNAAK